MKKRNRKWKRRVAAFLSAAMIFGLCQGSALAVEGKTQTFTEASTPSDAENDTLNEEKATESEAKKKYPSFEYEEEFDGITVSLKAGKGILPEGTTVEIQELDPFELETMRTNETASPSEAEKEEHAEGETELPSFAFDIKLYDAEGNDLGDSWQKNGDVTVSFRGERVDTLKDDASYVQILHIAEDGREEIVKETEMTKRNRRKEGLSFQAEHFSVYAVRAVASGEVNSEEALKKALETADSTAVITIEDNFELSGQIKIPEGKTITLTGDKTLSVAKEAGFIVPETSELRLDGGLEFIGQGKGHKPGGQESEKVHLVPVISVHGKLEQSNTAFRSFSMDRQPIILVKGTAAEYQLKGGTISENSITGSTPGPGVIQALEGAKFLMSGGTISKNETFTESDCAPIIHIGIDGSNAVGIKDPIRTEAASFKMSGGEISQNIATQTIFVGEISAAYGPGYEIIENVYAHHAEMKMSGDAIITGNKVGKAGGGVCVWGPGKFVMDGGTISDNTAPMGGGVAAADTYTMGASSDGQSHRNGTIEKWSEQCPATFVMNGGRISGNTADGSEGGVGGGIYIASNTCELNGGTIEDNTANAQGGGIYVSSLPYALKIKNALVTENEADILGGGMWLCPTGDAKTSVTNGVAFFDNLAGDGAEAQDTKAAGDDIASVNKKNNAAELNLLNRMLGNWIVHWYRDGGIREGYEGDVLGAADPDTKRYPASEENGKKIDHGTIEGRKENITLKAVVSEDGKKAAEAAAKKNKGVFIRGNKALRGGGIGSNGSIMFGDNPISYSKGNLTVKKVWDDNENEEGKRPEEIIAELYENGSRIDSVFLNRENNWSFTFVDLPVYGTDIAEEQESGKEKIRYEIKEQVPDGYEAVITPGPVVLEKGKDVEIRIKNSIKQPEPKTVDLSIEKKVTGKGSTTKAFRFELSLTNQPQLNGTYGDLQFNEGRASFTLKHGERKTASALPDGTEFTVREEAEAWYTPSVEELDESGTVRNTSGGLTYSGSLSAENGNIMIRYDNYGFSGGSGGNGGGGGVGGSTPGKPYHPEPVTPIIPEGQSPETSASPHPEINRLPVMGVPGPTESVGTEASAKTQQLAAANQPLIAALADKYAQNNDLGGWLTVPGTGGGYPVMYSPYSWEYYLHHGFDRKSSRVGVPFMGEATEIGGDNTLIHGHNMNGELQFGWIWNYQSPDFRAKHPTIDFKTIYDGDGQYEVMSIFFSPVYPAEQTNVFKWYQYVGKLNKAQFDYYVQNAKANSLYDTGVTAEYGDRLITLETCASYTTNERLVVVARKKATVQAGQQ